MEWEQAGSNLHNGVTKFHRNQELLEEERRGRIEGEAMGEGVLYVKVMTDEQMEDLRRQISVYATICETLVEMHKAITAHHDSLAGMRIGSMYCDPLMMPGGPKITARQRWTPTPIQLQILESIFDQGNGTPSKQKIKEITLQLTQHGQISETNVYNWFQNRRARSKRKQTAAHPNNNNSTESEAEAEIASPNEKRSKSEKPHEKLPSTVDDHSFPSTEVRTALNYIDPEPKRTQGLPPSNDCSKSSGSLSQMSIYNNDSRVDQRTGKMELPVDYNPFQPEEGFDMIG